MLSKLKNFCASEDGAVTVDWVVLTAAIVVLAGGVILAINGSSGTVSSGTGDFLTDRPVGG
ncbi:MAG: pilus assembly protein [Sulfitobacter sp.]